MKRNLRIWPKWWPPSSNPKCRKCGSEIPAPYWSCQNSACRVRSPGYANLARNL